MTSTESDIRGDLVAVMRKFADGDIEASAFVSRYMRIWRSWRDSDEPTLLNSNDIADALDRAFTASDCYKAPEIPYRTAVDIDEKQLRTEIAGILSEIVDT